MRSRFQAASSAVMGEPSENFASRSLKRIGELVVRDRPAFRQARLQLGAGLVDADQHVVHVGKDPEIDVLRRPSPGPGWCCPRAGRRSARRRRRRPAISPARMASAPARITPYFSVPFMVPLPVVRWVVDRNGMRRCPRATGRSTGAAPWAQISCACGQRGWNGQPDGRSMGLGGSPRSEAGANGAIGIDVRHGSQQRAGVGMLGRREHILGRADLHDAAQIHHRDLPAQVPHHAEIVRDEDERTDSSGAATPSSRLRICAWIETSSAATHSSAMIRRGSTARARAMPTRWHCPPLSWCGRRSASSGDKPTRLQQLGNARRDARPQAPGRGPAAPRRSPRPTGMRGLSEA